MHAVLHTWVLDPWFRSSSTVVSCTDPRAARRTWCRPAWRCRRRGPSSGCTAGSTRDCEATAAGTARGTACRRSVDGDAVVLALHVRCRSSRPRANSSSRLVVSSFSRRPTSPRLPASTSVDELTTQQKIWHTQSNTFKFRNHWQPHSPANIIA